MYKTTLGLSLLIATSPAVMADNFYSQSSPSPKTHYEATSGGIGLLVGTLAGGPIGAIIGGSMGVVIGNQQHKTETITMQTQTIAELEQELNQITAELDRSKTSVQTAQTKIKILESSQQQSLQQHREDLIQFSKSYQFDIYFLTNKASITPHAQQGLIKLAKLLENNPTIHANIEAHSDWRGSSDANSQLANRRLLAVRDQLVQAGTPPNQLLTTNYGEQANDYDGLWDEALFYDRRVTIGLSYYE